ncbi:MAG TPA: hypothetical protein VLD39_12050 [Gammaproteobacteria bacterium]|nr:hypothetical protein [Gammaproteobacteria bacterium]
MLGSAEGDLAVPTITVVAHAQRSGEVLTGLRLVVVGGTRAPRRVEDADVVAESGSQGLTGQHDAEIAVEDQAVFHATHRKIERLTRNVEVHAQGCLELPEPKTVTIRQPVRHEEIQDRVRQRARPSVASIVDREIELPECEHTLGRERHDRPYRLRIERLVVVGAFGMLGEQMTERDPVVAHTALRESRRRERKREQQRAGPPG